MEKSTKENKATKNTKSKKSQAATVKKTSSAKATTPKKKTTSTTKTAQKKTSSTVATKKSAATKKATTPKKKTTSKKIDSSSKMKIDLLEYYDLPYRYNQTVVKLLFQTPKTLFVYWDITDSDRKQYEQTYGENFFENTKPVLIIHNETKQYTFEIEINDFANSWYFHVPDPDCKYIVELGRRPRNQQVHLPNDYLYITSSNQLDAPNDKILFHHNNGKVIYKNAKTYQLSQKDFGSITFMRNLKEIYSISDFYQLLYGKDFLQELQENRMKNPTSGIM